MNDAGGRFAGRVAIVTGAASGIGAATARRLANEGAAVVAVDLDSVVERTAEQAAASGGEATAVVVDVAATDSWDRVVRAAEQFGPPDVLVSNAFTTDVRPATELTLESWNRQLSVNLTAAFLGFRACQPGLARSTAVGGGAVVLISSVHAIVGLPGHAAYAASKGGLVSLTRELAAESAPRVRVNAVLPGPILTRAWDGVTDEDQARSARATALGRLGNSDEVAATIAFLGSPDAAFITGASLVVDGGWSIVKDSA